MGSRSKLFILIATVQLMMSAGSSAQLYINEILASNNSINYDPHFYNFSDWIEIYNAGSTTVDLMGYTLTDDIQIPDKYRINYHLTIDSRRHVVIWADGESWYPHTNFSLDRDGEVIALFDPAGNLVDSLRYGTQLPDISYGRYPDGSGNWLYMPEPTYSQKNLAGVDDPSVISGKILFSQGGGLYQGSQVISLSTDSPLAVIRYTTDGTWPGAVSPIYTSPISISSNKVIRARSFEEGTLPGPVCTESYLITEGSNLPVISISTDRNYFFNSRYGIYVVGTNGVSGNCVDSAVNFNQPWERAANFEYYTPDGRQMVNQVIGVKIAGRCSRTRSIKSLGLYTREKYGKVGFDGYQFFNSKTLDTPKDLLLRNSGTEAYSTYLRDGFMQTLIMGRMDLDFQAYQPVTVFINGKYWGIHNLREKMNEHYVESNYGIDPESIDLLEYNTISDFDFILQGDSVVYNQFLGYITSHDLGIPEHYEYVKSQMDVEEFMNILIANIYFENEDWPHNNNKFWRERSENGKWRWYMFDLDFGFGFWPRSGNTVEWVFGRAPNSEIASSLKQNQGFSDEFVQRLASHLNTTFRTGRVLHILDSLKGNIDQEMYRHIERWGNPWSHGKWESNIQVMRDFAMERTPIVISQVMEEFGLSDTFRLQVVNQQPEMGRIDVAGVTVPGAFSGFYFSNVPLQVRAIPHPGYRFTGWSGSVESTEREITIRAADDISLVANFGPVVPEDQLHINEFLTSNTGGLQDEHHEFEDWIEIYNGNESPVDLAGWYLSDSAGFLTQSRIPEGYPELTAIPAKGYKLLWADNDTEQGCLHLSFKLSKGGETIFLSQQIGEDVVVIDSLQYVHQYTDVTFGRDPGDPGLWKYLEPTPGAENRERRLENIFINEFLASNRSILQDRDGQYDDWIEIYNANPYPVDVAGMFISDDYREPTKHRIPDQSSDSTTIPAGGHLVLWADDSTEQGILHLNFKLSGQGEEIILTHPNGIGILDTVTYPDLLADTPFGRSIDGYGAFCYMPATPGAANQVFSYEGIVISEIAASDHQVLADGHGEYDDWIELFNSTTDTIDIAGMGISDTLAPEESYMIPYGHREHTVIEPGGFLILWADDSTEQGPLHLDFRLREKGEQVAIFAADGSVLDAVDFPNQYDHYSYSRLEDDLWMSIPPTPGERNTVKVIENLFINEYMSDNENVVADEYGEYDDWIEVYNDNPYPVDLGGLYLSDSMQQPDKFRIPSNQPGLTVIPAGGYLVIWTDSDPDQGTLHANFKLSKEGEDLLLSGYDFRHRIDGLSYDKQYSNFATGRLNDTGPWCDLPPTPGARNTLPDLDGLYINEIMTSNVDTHCDEYGEYDDWIEFYNGSPVAVDLGGLYITDSIGDPDPFRISSNEPDSTTIPPYGYLVFWADDSTEQGILHTNFRLSRSGEQVALLGYDRQVVIDSVSYGLTARNSSYGRWNDGELPWAIMDLPTPLSPNIITSSGIPADLTAAVCRIYPNPAADHVIISFQIDDASELRLKVYDQRGTLVAAPVDGFYGSGRHEITWDLGRHQGSPLGSGIYIYVLEAGNQRVHGKITVISNH